MDCLAAVAPLVVSTVSRVWHCHRSWKLRLIKCQLHTFLSTSVFSVACCELLPCSANCWTWSLRRWTWRRPSCATACTRCFLLPALMLALVLHCCVHASSALGCHQQQVGRHVLLLVYGSRR
jgi:hypothetical protein